MLLYPELLHCFWVSWCHWNSLCQTVCAVSKIKHSLTHSTWVRCPLEWMTWWACWRNKKSTQSWLACRAGHCFCYTTIKGLTPNLRKFITFKDKFQNTNFIHPFVNLCIYSFSHLSIHPSGPLIYHLFLHLYIYPSINHQAIFPCHHSFIHTSSHPFIKLLLMCQSIHSFSYSSVHSSTHPCIFHLSIHLSILQPIHSSCSSFVRLSH